MINVHDPEYNKEQIAKQLLLLEDHMQPDKFCEECVQKHLLTAEAFAEEGYQLGDDTMGEYAQKIRALRKEILGHEGHSHSHSPDAKKEVAKLLLEMKPSSEKEEYAKKEATARMLLSRVEYDPSVQAYMREHGISRKDLEDWLEYWEEKRSDPEPVIEHGENVFVEHFVEKEACDPRSFRVIKPNPEHILTICCPVGQFDPEADRCKVGTIRQKLEHLHPEEESCPACQMSQ